MRDRLVPLLAVAGLALGLSVGCAVTGMMMDRGEPRSPHWPAVRRAHLRQHPGCAVCGATNRVEVHHANPFHVRPELELEPTNLATMCRMPHHFYVGHHTNWSYVNTNLWLEIEAASNEWWRARR